MKREKLFCAISFIIPSLVLFGNYSLLNMRVAGLVMTPYRVFVPVMFIMLLLIQNKQDKSLKVSVYERFLYCVTGIWVIYGAATIAFFPYADFHDGVLELLSLILGTMTVSCTVILLRNETWNHLVIGIKVAVVITIIIGLYEIFTANHLSTSYYSDPELLRFNRAVYGAEADSFKWFVATSVFYNENDYSAMLAVFVPFFITGQKTDCRKIRMIDNIALCAAFFILLCNNAFICFVAFLIGFIVALFFGIKGVRNRIIPIISLLFTRFVIVKLWEDNSRTKLGLGATLASQIINNRNGQGSMYYRINTYLITIRETFLTSKGMGFGAGGFTNYFSELANSNMIMVNPHCFWLEILSEYGVAIFTLFIAFLITIMVTLIKIANRTKDNKSIAVIASGMALIVASVAPSSYLKASYYWIPIAMAVFLAGYGYKNEVIT